MPKRLKKASKPIINEGITEVSESQRKHYAKLGYRPYISNNGKIKWLSYEQHIYETIKYGKRRSIFSLRFFRPRQHNIARSARSIFRIIHDNWLLILLISIVLIALLNINQIIGLISNL